MQGDVTGSHVTTSDAGIARSDSKPGAEINRGAQDDLLEDSLEVRAAEGQGVERGSVAIGGFVSLVTPFFNPMGHARDAVLEFCLGEGHGSIPLRKPPTA
jgi:hypothetical protein